MATLGQPLTAPESGWKRIDDTLIENTGTGWTKTSNVACWGGSIIEKQTPTASDTFKFTFLGTKIRLIDYKTASRGNRSITIDGVTEIYSCANSSQITQALVYEKLGLQYGYHDVTISSVTGSWFSLDAIDIDSDAKLFSFGYRLNKILLSSGDKYSLKDSTVIKMETDSEENFLNHGADLITNFNGYVTKQKDVKNTSALLGSGKTFEHTIDMSKRRTDKIKLG